MRILAIDAGERRMGLAISDPSGVLARPWQTLECRGSVEQALQALLRVIEVLMEEEDGLSEVVVGLPRHLDGTPSPMTGRAQALRDGLSAQITLPIVFQDERLSSHEAESRLAVRERDWRKRKLRLDAAAAAVILQDYLDARPRAAQPELPR